LTKGLISTLIRKPITEAKISSALRKSAFQIEDNQRVAAEDKQPKIAPEVIVAPGAIFPSFLGQEAKDPSGENETRPESQQSLLYLMGDLHQGKTTGAAETWKGSAAGKTEPISGAASPKDARSASAAWASKASSQKVVRLSHEQMKLLQKGEQNAFEEIKLDI